MGAGGARTMGVISSVAMRSEGRVWGRRSGLGFRQPLAVAWRAQWRERLSGCLPSSKSPSFLSFFGRVCLSQGVWNRGKSKDFGAKQMGTKSWWGDLGQAPLPSELFPHQGMGRGLSRIEAPACIRHSGASCSPR